MKTLILTAFGVVVGYITGNLEYKTFEEVMEELTIKITTIIKVTKDFAIATLSDIEGYDSDEIKANVDALIDALRSKAEVISSIESFEEKVYFIEDEVAKFAERVATKYTNDKLNR